MPGAIDELDGQLPGGACPGLVRLPDEVIPAALWVVAQPTLASCLGGGWLAARVERVGIDLLDGGEAFRQDIQTLVTGQAELDGACLPGSTNFGIGSQVIMSGLNMEFQDSFYAFYPFC